MAGVGFQLNRILSKQRYTSLLQAYAYAGLIGSGPWLIAVIALGFMGMILTGTGVVEDLRVFFVSVSVIYGFTLVLTGPVQMVLTRYAADQQYSNKPENIFPTFVFSLAWVSLVFTGIGLLFFLRFVEGTLLFRLAGAFSMVLVAAIWVTGIFLTAIKDFHTVLWAFAAGCAVIFSAGLWLGVPYGAGGVMTAFACGHALMLLILCFAVFKELGNTELGRPDFKAYFTRYWDLALGGLLYNLGIWIDKFLYWWMDPRADHVSGVLYTAPVYDRVVYFSFLTIAPGMAVFLLKLETDFSIKNQAFFEHVLKKATLGQILQLKEAVIESLREGFSLLLKVQGLFTVLLILSANQILDLLNLGAVQAGVFQISLLSVFLLVMFLAMLTVLYYLDKRRDALFCCLILTVVNGVFTASSIVGGERFYGVGFLLASASAMLFAAIRVNRHLQHLDYDTFCKQPVYG